MHTLSIFVGNFETNLSETLITMKMLNILDKSTSTDDVSINKISFDLSDAVSQLSYNSPVFDDRLLQSLSSGQSQRASSNDSNEVSYFSSQFR
jgi:hypothetical protein